MIRSSCYLLTTIAVVALVGTAIPLALANPVDHGSHMIECAKVCANTQVQCDSCFKHCFTLVSEGKHDHALCAQYCLDCADCCKMCESLCARQGPLSSMALDFCAKCCDECALQCEKMPGDAKMADCAKSCRTCAASCRDMAKQLNATK